MKERIALTVENRTPGKRSSRSLRKDKKVPAVLYGAKRAPQNIFVDEILIKKFNTRAYENALFSLKSSDASLDNTIALMKDVNVHPVSQKPTHVDFYAIDLTKTIRVFVEIRLEGKPIGIAEGGLLNATLREVEVEVLPTNIPEFFTLDVSGLGVGQALHVSDLALPAGVKVLSAAAQTLAVVNKESEKAEAVATPDAAAAAATPAAAAGGKAAPAAAAGAKAPAAGKAAPAAAKAPAKK